MRSGLGLLLAGVTMATTPIGTVAQEAPRPARYATEVFAELPTIESPVLSPNGKMLAAKIAIKGTQYFAIVKLDTPAEPLLIGLGEADLNWWKWVNDEWLVIGVGRLLPMEGDEWYISRAASVNALTGKSEVLAAKDAAQMADDIVWTAKDGSPRVMMALQTSIYKDNPGFYPRVDEINLATGKRKTVLSSRPGVWDWYPDGDGVVRMGIGMSDDGRSRRLLYRDDDHSGFRVIDRARTRADGLTVPKLFLKDRGKAVMIADDENGYSALYELDLKTLERGEMLFATPGYDIGGLVPDTDGFHYLGVHVNENKPGIHWTDPAFAAMQAKAASLIKGGSPEILSLSRDRSTAIVHVGFSNAPGAYFLFKPAEESMTLLSMVNPTLAMKRLHPVKTIRYKARDGLEIAAVLTLPRGATAKNLPLIVMPHGGPFARDTEEWDWWTQFLADRGYAVIQPNYRGSSGYGTPFTQKGEGQWGLAMQDDLNDAVKALADQGIADSKRVCMVGASYGGYAAMRAAQRDGALYRCAVSYAGVSDLNRMLKQNSSFLGSGARSDWLKEQAPDLKAVSPLYGPEQFSIPILLFHGKKDRVVLPVQSRALVSKLKAAGKDYSYVEQPEGDHHFSRSADRLEFLKALEAFLAKHNPA